MSLLCPTDPVLIAQSNYECITQWIHKTMLFFSWIIPHKPRKPSSPWTLKCWVSPWTSPVLRATNHFSYLYKKWMWLRAIKCSAVASLAVSDDRTYLCAMLPFLMSEMMSGFPGFLLAGETEQKCSVISVFILGCMRWRIKPCWLSTL